MFQSGFCHEVFHNKFRHRGAADITVADEQYFYHGDSPSAFSCNGFLLLPILTGKEVWITVENAFDCCKADISAVFTL